MRNFTSNNLAFTQTLDAIANGTGLQGVLLNGGQPINFSQIFEGLPQFYAGSSFTVQEILRLELNIDNDSLIDKDLKWFPEKIYAGTYTFGSNALISGINPENRGFIEYYVNEYVRYNTYTISANPDVPIGLHGLSAIDNCNFILQTAAAIVGPVRIGQSFPTRNSAMLSARHSLEKVPLIDREFYPQMSSIGLYIAPGLSISTLKYKVQVINAIYCDVAQFPSITCRLPPEADCEASFTLFLDTHNAISSAPRWWRTEAQAVAEGLQRGFPRAFFTTGSLTYTCPADNGITYLYWRIYYESV